MKYTIENSIKLATQKGLGFSVSRHGKKFGMEYWSKESIVETATAIQFKGNAREFFKFMQTLPNA